MAANIAPAGSGGGGGGGGIHQQSGQDPASPTDHGALQQAPGDESQQQQPSMGFTDPWVSAPPGGSLRIRTSIPTRPTQQNQEGHMMDAGVEMRAVGSVAWAGASQLAQPHAPSPLPPQAEGQCQGQGQGGSIQQSLARGHRTPVPTTHARYVTCSYACVRGCVYADGGPWPCA